MTTRDLLDRRISGLLWRLFAVGPNACMLDRNVRRVGPHMVVHAFAGVIAPYRESRSLSPVPLTDSWLSVSACFSLVVLA